MCLLDFPCKFSKLQYKSLAFVAGYYIGLLTRVHYPKLHNIVHTISLCMFYCFQRIKPLFINYNTSVTCNDFSKLKRKLLFPISSQIGKPSHHKNLIPISPHNVFSPTKTWCKMIFKISNSLSKLKFTCSHW